MTYPPGPPEPSGTPEPPGGPHPPGPGQPPPPPAAYQYPVPPGGPGAPLTGAPPPGGPPGPRPTNVLAIVSLVLSVISYCALPIVGAIGGIITGHIAKRQIRDTGEEGTGLATAGIVLGWVHIGLFVLAAAAAIALAIAGATIIDRSPTPYDSGTPGRPSPSIELPSPFPS